MTTETHPHPYVQRCIEKDFIWNDPPLQGWYGQTTRIATAVLNVVSVLPLPETAKWYFSFGMGSVRFATSLLKLGSENDRSWEGWMTVATSLAGVAGTYFRHPLGMLIATVHDMCGTVQSLLFATLYELCGTSLSVRRDKTTPSTALLDLVGQITYVALFFFQSPWLTLGSLSLECARNLYKGNQNSDRLLGASQILAGLIRGHQGIREYQTICIEKDIQEAKKANKPYLPLINKAQKTLMQLGWWLNGWSRWTMATILSAPKELKTWAIVLPALPITAFTFILSAPYYLFASYAGTGRFEIVFPKEQLLSSVGNTIKVVCRNILGQDPWSLICKRHGDGTPFAPPEQRDVDGNYRLKNEIDSMVSEDPDIITLQEAESQGVMDTLTETLSNYGYTVVVDRNPKGWWGKNNSGLCIAVNDSNAVKTVDFVSIASEDKNGWMMHGSDRGIMSIFLRGIQWVNIHLNYGNEPADQPARITQFKKYVVPKIQDKSYYAVVGDANMDTAKVGMTALGLPNARNAFENQTTCNSLGDGPEKIDVLIHPPNIKVTTTVTSDGHSDHVQLNATVTRVALN